MSEASGSGSQLSALGRGLVAEAGICGAGAVPGAVRVELGASLRRRGPAGPAVTATLERGLYHGAACVSRSSSVDSALSPTAMIRIAITTELLLLESGLGDDGGEESTSSAAGGYDEWYPCGFGGGTNGRCREPAPMDWPCRGETEIADEGRMGLGGGEDGNCLEDSPFA